MKKEFHIIILAMLLSLMTGGMTAMAQSGAKVHTVQQKETLYRISKMYDVTVAELYRLNPDAREGIKVGQKLILPDNVNAPSSNSYSVNPQSDETYHAVQKGETLYSISRRYDVTVKEILAANPSLKENESLPLGVVLKIPAPSSFVQSGSTSRPKTTQTQPVKPSSNATSLKVITVPQGATVYSIVKTTNWTEKDFYTYNPQAEEGLKAGMKIMVPSDFKGVIIPGEYADSPDSRTGFPQFTPSSRAISVVLTLPFKQDKERRFADYYEGFLLMLSDAKKKGISVDLYVYDCASDMLSQTISQIDAIPSVDLIIGGVSLEEMNELATISQKKGATYVIPFTSRKLTATDLGNLQIYQINTPHESLYEEASGYFVKQYNGYHVHFVNYAGDSSSKDDFVAVLKQKLRKTGMTYSESDQTLFNTAGTVESLVQQYGKMVVIPNSGSQSAARNTLNTISHAVDSVGVDKVTAFGYPEWQTYAKNLSRQMKKVNAAFYTTFYINTKGKAYPNFEREFLSWYGHSTGLKFPRYSVLGYDTGAFFIMPDVGEPVGKGNRFIGDREYKGIQSNFHFYPAYDNRNLHSNLGVFFVKYLSDGSIERI